MTRQAQLSRWLAAMTGFERRLRGDAGRARNALILAAARRYRTRGEVPGFLAEAHRRRVEGVLAAHYGRVIPHFGGIALAQIKSVPVRPETKQRLFADLAAEWIAREALRKAKLIADTDAADVRDAIAAGFDAGEGAEAVARRIRRVTALTPARAATVARTETHAAATFGSLESVRSAEAALGVTMAKEWLATRDGRTRPDHAAADGQRVPLDGRFSVGGEPMDRPGDPSASPENVIACRCALTYSEA